ncbi:MAG: hypothetical protein ACNI25_05160 [Halarcobacter sp.]
MLNLDFILNVILFSTIGMIIIEVGILIYKKIKSKKQNSLKNEKRDKKEIFFI